MKKILFHIGHPAHVHLFKNTIWNLERDGYEVYVTAMDKEIALQLLDAYGIRYNEVGKNVRGLFNKACNMVKVDLKLLKSVKKLGADVLVSVGSPYLAYISILTRKIHVSFEDTDTESSKFDWLLIPFTVHVRPTCYKEDVQGDMIPHKVLRHFSLIPRIKHMFRCKGIANCMSWHDSTKSTDYKMHVPSDSSDLETCGRKVA